MIGDNIEIVISKIEDGSVKIGVKAPKDIQVLRKELCEEIEQENRAATKIDISMLGNIKKK